MPQNEVHLVVSFNLLLFQSILFSFKDLSVRLLQLNVKMGLEKTTERTRVIWADHAKLVFHFAFRHTLINFLKHFPSENPHRHFALSSTSSNG